MAHGLNQPLTGVGGLAGHTLIAIDRGWELPPATIRIRMARTVEQADRMAHTIEHVRAFARESGRPERSWVDVREVVQASLDMVAGQFRSHGIVLEIDCQIPCLLCQPTRSPRSVVELSGGMIGIQSTQNSGATAIVQLPVVDAG